ncbi:hypothetical protein HRUBRA_02526 [Pseudohaliea rubra DSM 19751]|uniref:Divalent metal cation transporter n=1 Tax=Pseudohaliea rubra DSM 19751 TaxID=1265313 RepID=A0A095VN30_9GAMM|nr:hypothetical protein HRUBRA_02526 [Pseudohaliea rubra DSM 19751]
MPEGIPLLRSLGPGIMMAAAAVGGSHLVASTKAGAIYGWQLLALVLLVNLFKYPFFRAGVHYTMGTGESLVEGYARLGRPYLTAFAALALISGMVNVAALTLFSASLLGYFLPFTASLKLLSGLTLLACLGLLAAGRFRALSALSKGIMISLTAATLTAVAIAAGKAAVPTPGFVAPRALSAAAIGFIVITMGWMPAPIEISSITSQWLKRQRELQAVTPASALRDFNIGYVVTTVLAVVFLALGALILYGTGVELAESGIGFARQLVGLYAATIGSWSGPLIALIAFLCIFGSTITALDGYARVLAEAWQRLTRQAAAPSEFSALRWILGLALAAVAILVFFSTALMPMMNFAMIMAFLTTPFFAWLNYLLVFRTPLPEAVRPGRAFVWLARLGLTYLLGFLLLFIWWRWLL